MTDIEDLLARELGQVADAVPAPRVDLLGVRRVAGRERRLRRGLVVAAVAAAVALVVGLSVVLPGVAGRDRVGPAGGAGADDLRLAWSSGDIVHLPSGHVLRVDGLRAVVSRGGTTIVQTEDSQWQRVDDGGDEPELRGLTTSPALGTPVLSLDGSHAAWLQTVADRDGYRLCSFDLGAGPGVVTTIVDAGAAGSAVLGVTGVDDRGRVLVDRRDGSQLLWDPTGVDAGPEVVGTDPEVDGGVVLLTGTRVVVYPRDQTGAPVLSELVDAADLRKIADLRQVEPPGFNDDATAYASSTAQPELVALDESGEQTSTGPLRLPAGTWRVAGWESADTVVLSDGGGRLERCVVGSPDCAPVPSIGDGVVATT